MKQVTNHLKRIVTLTNTHGISPDGVNPANTEDELDYVESKIRFNAIEALRILNSEDKGEGNKPSTKSSYEKVDLSLCDFIEGFQAGKLFYYQGGEYHQIETERQAMFHASRDSYFVEVEKTIEWWEDLVECIDNTTDGSGYAESIKGEKLHVNASMTRDQWCDFARILLEQGE